MKKLPYDEALIDRLRDDLERLSKAENKIAERQSRIESGMKDAVERDAMVEAIAFQLQAFYTGIEAFLERALAATGTKIAKGADSHVQILTAAHHAKLVPEGHFDFLKDLTKFRHYARHGYGYDLEEKIVLLKANDLSGFWTEFQKMAKEFIKKLAARLEENKKRDNPTDIS